MNDRAPPPAPGTILLALASIVAAALGGFAAGRIHVGRTAPAAPPGSAARAEAAAPALPVAEALALELAEAPLPAVDELGFDSWRSLALKLEEACARRGLTDLPETWRRAGDPAELAALADACAWIEHAARRPDESRRRIEIARVLDPDPTRDSLRAPMLANDDVAVRTIAAGLDASRLPLRTATLLGAALLRAGDVEPAIEAWRTASLENPGDATLHVLLGWRLLGLDPPWIDEARRHLEAARALLPDNASLKMRLDALKG